MSGDSALMTYETVHTLTINSLTIIFICLMGANVKTDKYIYLCSEIIVYNSNPELYFRCWNNK